MSWGIRVFNEYGEKLIDSDDEMAHLHSEQDIYPAPGEQTITISYPILTNMPIILASAIDGKRAHINVRPWKTGASWDRADVRIISSEATEIVRVWVFARGEGGNGGSYGIKAYRADGSVSFDSSRRTIRHHFAFSGTVNNNQIVAHDFTPLAYPPPVAVNARFQRIWGTGSPANRVYLQLLEWGLIKDAGNNYYRLNISLGNILWALAIYWDDPLPSLDYSGFIFKDR